MRKLKIKLLETRRPYIHYEVYENKNKINSGWYKYNYSSTKGQIAKEIEEMFNKEYLEE